MGWTKHADAVLAHREALTRVRAGLRSLVGKLESREDCHKVICLLRHHERLCSALAYGRRDGVIKVETGSAINYKHKNMKVITEELIRKGPKSFTFRRAAA